MQKLIFLLSMMVITAVCNAQLANTSWAGVMTIPIEVNVYLKFTADSAQIIIKDGDYVGETMLYSVKDTVITFKKVSGNSPCSTDPFTVGYTIKDNQLLIKTILDPCDGRGSMWPTEPFVKTSFK